MDKDRHSVNRQQEGSITRRNRQILAALFIGKVKLEKKAYLL